MFNLNKILANFEYVVIKNNDKIIFFDDKSHCLFFCMKIFLRLKMILIANNN